MSGFLSGVRGGSDTGFDSYDEFVPAHLPEPGDFLDGHDVLTGREHLAFHRFARRLFEERGVYDMTFGYNLARLNLDQRHPDAGFRYAVETGAEPVSPETAGDESGDWTVLRAEFTPTTEFCPQSDTLTIGSFRAFNAERERHQFDLVRVRVDGMHHESTSINGKLKQLERTFEETGTLRADVTGSGCGGGVPTERGRDAPF